MATIHEFWVHGLEAHVQNEPDPIATEQVLRDDYGYTYPNPRRNNQGTRIRQNEGGNWFHFAIPTPIALQPSTHKHPLKLTGVLLRGRANGLVRLKRVVVWIRGAPKAERIFEHDRPGEGYLRGDFEIDYESTFDYEWKDPLAIDIYVEFDEGGDITFGGAGVRFEAERPDWLGVRQDVPCYS